MIERVCAGYKLFGLIAQKKKSSLSESFDRRIAVVRLNEENDHVSSLSFIIDSAIYARNCETFVFSNVFEKFFSP